MIVRTVTCGVVGNATTIWIKMGIKLVYLDLILTRNQKTVSGPF